ncbi:hypothetical protein [Chryseobacterium sp. MEBOG07]|uniref:hypothetical protein n=1 Tax=Chryseobacterium sp. MEBOG07 TaxID=2879939 RepID=UPI001F1FBF7B|nr:hypothetical protein [Chryseobacterium sp. MEBOG07]UKB79568.1 hypothetical protein LF886_00745 [Chryseobacterium sp. MEBOG07]
MFQGAIGKTFHKIYEPFLSYKDELSILTKIKPKTNILESIKKLGIDDKKLALIKEILNDDKSS